MRIALVCIALVCCSKETPAPAPAASSATPVASAAAPFDTHSKWWDLARQSKVYTDDRRIDADNRLKMLPLDQRVKVVQMLDDMAKQPANGTGFHDAAEKARDAQTRITDPNGPSSDHSAVFRAIAETSLIVLSGLAAKACAEKLDAAGMKLLVQAIRTVPLPKIPAPGLGQLGDGRNERNQIEQELKMALDDKAYQAATKDAPPPAKNPP